MPLRTPFEQTSTMFNTLINIKYVEEVSMSNFNSNMDK